MITRVVGVAVAAACLAVCVEAQVVAIDPGSAYVKTSLVKPGMPFEIVINTQSKRKTEAMLAFYNGERLFGGDANGLWTRKPALTFRSPQLLLGRNSSHDVYQQYFHAEQYLAFDHSPAESRGGGIDYKLPEPEPVVEDEDFNPESDPAYGLTLPTNFTAEEMTAQLFSHIKAFTEVIAEGKVKDVVLTVPAFYTQNERIALQDAARLAGFKVLGMIDENYAAGVQFSLDRVFENETHHLLIYNMGHSHTQASVMALNSYTVKERGVNKTVGQFKVIGKGWDQTLGGSAIERLIVEKFADAFDAKHNLNVRSIPRAMAKFRKKAGKVKEILSANEEFPVTIESLTNDIDFKFHIKRSDLEAWSAPLFARALQPIEDALSDAKLSVGDIDTVEIVGGGVRVPAVKALLADFFGESLPLGVHLNGDEAMALGAAFVAANRSTAFRVRKVGALDTTPFAIGVKLNNLLVDDDVADLSSDAAEAAEDAADDAAEDGEDAPKTKKWSKRSTMFNRYNVVGSTKKISFKHDRDITALVRYEAMSAQRLPAGTSTTIGLYNITGIAEVANGPKSHLGTPKVSLSFSLDNNGIVSLKNAEATLEEMVEVTPTPTPTPRPTKSPKAKKARKLKEDEEGEDAAEGDDAADADADADADASEKKVEDEDVAEEKGEADTDADADAAADAESDDAEKSTDEADDADAAKDGDKDASEEDAADTKEEEAAEEEQAPKEPVFKKVVHRFPLKVSLDTSALAIRPLTKKEFNASKRKLNVLQSVDDERFRRDAAKNKLEAFIYSIRDKLYTEIDDLEKVSTAEQREALSEVLTEVEDWLYDEGDSTTTTKYAAKNTEITTLSNPIFDALELMRNPPPPPPPPPAANATDDVNGTDADSANNSTTTEKVELELEDGDVEETEGSDDAASESAEQEPEAPADEGEEESTVSDKSEL